MISTKNDSSEPRTCNEQMDRAARMVQDVAYALANRVDNTTMTELMLASRKLERLAERINASNLGATELAKEET